MTKTKSFFARFPNLALIPDLVRRVERGDRWCLFHFYPCLLIQSELLRWTSYIAFLGGVFHVEIISDICVVTAAPAEQKAECVAGLVEGEVVEGNSLVTKTAIGNKYSLVFAPPGSMVRTLEGLAYIVTDYGFRLAVVPEGTRETNYIPDNHTRGPSHRFG